MAIQKPRGTQDLLPSVLGNWYYIENTIRRLCKTYGFEEVRTPMFEETGLFLRGIGETTDIVQKEMYSFPTGDKKRSILYIASRRNGICSTGLFRK